MIMHEFGKDNDKTILLLHGAGCTYKMWTPQIEELQKSFHLFVPTMSGHEVGDIDFTSSEEEAKIIVQWFHKKGIQNLHLICGASLGAHVAAEILQLEPKFATYAMVESLKAYQYKGVILKFFSWCGKKVLRKCAKSKGFMAGTYDQKYASDDSKDTILHMSNQSLDNIMIESGDYLIKEMDQRIYANTLILYGSKEKKECIRNTRILESQIEQCEVLEIDGYHHGELAIGNPEYQLELLKKLIRD